MTIRRHVYSCSNCGLNVEHLVDSNEVVYCECGEKMWVNFSFCDIQIDRTVEAYDKQLGAWIGNTSDRRKLLKQKGLESFASYDEIAQHNDTIKENKVKKEKDRYISAVVKSSNYLRANKRIVNQIAAEQKNTGTSATAKTISEVLA